MQYLGGYVASPKKKSLGAFRASAGFVVPESVDWRTEGAVTPVKNQGQCGSCWSFSTTGALEGAAFLSGRKLVSLSEQNILDCDHGGHKCQGGSMDQAFQWVSENGICAEADDTYKCMDQNSEQCTSSVCPTQCKPVLAAHVVTNSTDVDPSEGALEAAVSQQPVSVAIEADKPVFQHYTGGVLTNEACGSQLDHGVLAVGFGTDKGQKYWLVKNSWGTSFGEQGYIRIERGAAEDGGECGIRKAAVFPTVSKPSDDIFEDFKKRFARKYASRVEEDRRQKIFNENVKFIDSENSKGHSYTLGVTNHADLTFAEWRMQYLGGYVASPKKKSLGAFRASAGFVVPESVDWRTEGAVTPVKNQGQCGSCWSFSTTGALEGAAFLSGRKLVSLSEQNILDCDHGGHKCQGGSMDQAFQWVSENGICAEADDTYKCMDQNSEQCTSSVCPTQCKPVLAAHVVTNSTDVDPSEGALEAAVSQQPVSVAIEADKPVFQHYTGGVLTNEACGSQLDHGVLAVGFGTDKGQKYWLVKNSWGTSFGEQGYIRIERGVAEDGGECGIRKAAVFPTLSKAITEILV